MPLTRRTFLAASAAAGTLAATRGLDAAITPAAKPLSILILGGTGFIGPAQVRYAMARGHKVAVFNRGKTNAGQLPAGVEHIEGDRNGKLEALKDRKFDAVIDNPTTLPKWVRDAAAYLKDNTGQYIFISTLSVYADNSKPDMDETAPIIEGGDPNATEVKMEHYGALKAQAERETLAAYGKRATIVRPGLIVGSGDNSDRFTYWPVRIARGGEVLAPGTPNDPVQIIDARDLGEWTIRLVENKTFGTFNAIGPASRMTMAEMLYGIRAITSVPVSFTWVPADFLEEQKVRPWADMPAWLPASGEYAGFGSRSNKKAIAAGLTFRPLADTAKDTLAFHESRPAERQKALRAGLPADREAAVLAAWKAKKA
ncbi:MAG TPA: NAD-dependent epimerase/dehydratase family protein [Thermoanaerobaculia bacterium]